MKTKQIFTALFFAVLYVGLHAQDMAPAKVKEYGLGFSGLNNYSLQYRWGNEKKLMRLTGILGAGSTFGSTENINATTNGSTTSTKVDVKSPFNINLGLGFSVLHLKSITDKFGVLYGPSFYLNGAYNKRTDFQPYFYANNIGTMNVSGGFSTYYGGSISAGMALGVYYKLSDKFMAYAEITPSVFYSYSQRKTTNSYTTDTGTQLILSENTTINNSNDVGFSGLSNSNAMITLAYRITK